MHDNYTIKGRLFQCDNIGRSPKYYRKMAVFTAPVFIFSYFGRIWKQKAPHRLLRCSAFFRGLFLFRFFVLRLIRAKLSNVNHLRILEVYKVVGADHIVRA